MYIAILYAKMVKMMRMQLMHYIEKKINQINSQLMHYINKLSINELY